MLLAGVFLIYMTFVDGMKNPLYLIHIVPIYTALLAVWLAWAWGRGPIARWAVVSGVSAILLTQIAGSAHVIRRNTHVNAYRPVISFLRQQAAPGALIAGSAELAFALGFDANLVDDTRLGYASGKRPAFIVFEERYEGWRRHFRKAEPDVSRHIEDLLARDYAVVYRNSSYTVRRRLPEHAVEP